MSILRLNRFFAHIFAMRPGILLKRLPPHCLVLCLLYFLAIFLAAWLTREAKATLCCFRLFCLRCCLGPMFLFCVIVTFDCKLFLLTLSYLTIKDYPFGKFTIRGVARRPNITFSLIVSILFSHQTFY